MRRVRTGALLLSFGILTVFDGVVLFMGLYMIIKGALTYRKREAGMASDSPHADSASFPDENRPRSLSPTLPKTAFPFPRRPPTRKAGAADRLPTPRKTTRVERRSPRA